MKTEAETEVTLPPNQDRSHQELESRGRLLPQNLWKECSSGDSVIQDSARRNLCGFEPPGLWYFVTETLESRHNAESRIQGPALAFQKKR